MRPGAIELFPNPRFMGQRRLVLTPDLQVKRIVVGQGINELTQSPPYFQVAVEGDILLKRIARVEPVSKLPTIAAVRVSIHGFGSVDELSGVEIAALLNQLSPNVLKFLYNDDIGVVPHAIPSPPPQATTPHRDPCAR